MFTVILFFSSILLSSKIVIFNLSEAAFCEMMSLEDELNAVLSGKFIFWIKFLKVFLKVFFGKLSKEFETVRPNVNDEPPKYETLESPRNETPPPEYNSIS